MKHFLFLIAGVMMMQLPEKQFYFPSLINSTQMTQDTLVPVKIELEKTSIKNMQVLYIKDTAPTTEAIKDVIGNGYGELLQYIQENQLKPMKFMAWHYAMQPPWSMDVAIETDRMPAELKGRIQARVLPEGEVIIAHVWGPYDQLGQAYEQLQTWLIKNNRKPKGSLFEVYLNDPATVKNPMEIRTDIYQPVE